MNQLCLLQSIDPGQQFTWEHSNLEVNKPKNRYANVIAYDHSRVLLSGIDGTRPIITKQKASTTVSGAAEHKCTVLLKCIPTQASQTAYLISCFRWLQKKKMF